MSIDVFFVELFKLIDEINATTADYFYYIIMD